MDYTTDYYHVLRVRKNASREELKASYRQLVKLHHPDKNPGDAGAAERFRLVQEAYEVLSNDISRHVYDEYRLANQQAASEAPVDSNEETKTSKPSAANSRTFTQTRKIWREKRIYVMGRIQVKFQAEPELMESCLAGREQNYTIYPTETLVKIISSGVYKDGTSKEYEKAYSSAELFAVPLVQPIRCQMNIAGVDEYYELTIHDLKIKEPLIQNITRHEQDNFGELTGDCYGYIVHRYEAEVTETFTEYFGATGKVETKESAGVYFSRQQFYSKDGARFWGEWTVNTGATAKANNYAKAKPKPAAWSAQRRPADNPWKYFGWIIYLFIGLLIWPKLVLTLVILFAVLWLLFSFARIANRLAKFIPWLSAILFLLLLVIGINSLLHPVRAVVKNKTTQYQPLDTHKRSLENNNKDTLITHLVQWNDYDSNHYSMELSILQSAVAGSHAEHQAIPASDVSAAGIGAIYAQLQQMDTGRLQYVYRAFDSTGRSKNLDELQAAKMIVSCIQSIPYYLIVDQSCSANYNDEFISSYLRNCQNDCCLGDVKFGVQSPAEFIGDLKGDCDTRALVLFDILSRMGTDVALLTSPYYKHALIAVHFTKDAPVTGVSYPINGKNFYLWETTSAGHQPGMIPPAISNLQYWNVSLIHQQ